MKWATNQKAFTLIELMVTIAIIAILAAIAIPSYQGIQKRSARSEAKSNLLALSVALEGYFAENNDYGAANVYTYYGGLGASFNHSGNLETVANIGNVILYDYSIRTFTTPLPSYTIQAIPRRGVVAQDVILSLDSNGDKQPTGAW